MEGGRWPYWDERVREREGEKIGGGKREGTMLLEGILEIFFCDHWILT